MKKEGAMESELISTDVDQLVCYMRLWYSEDISELSVPEIRTRLIDEDDTMSECMVRIVISRN